MRFEGLHMLVKLTSPWLIMQNKIGFKERAVVQRKDGAICRGHTGAAVPPVRQKNCPLQNGGKELSRRTAPECLLG